MNDSDGTGAIINVLAVGAIASVSMGIWALATFVSGPSASPPPMASGMARSGFATNAAEVASAPTVVEPRPVPQWIWARPTDDAIEIAPAATLRRTLEIDEAAAPARAFVRFACDNGADLEVDGQPVGTSDAWQRAREVEIRLGAGAHEIVARARNESGAAGLVALVEIRGADGSLRWLRTDETWEVDDAPLQVLGAHGVDPWGEIPGLLGPDVERSIEARDGYVVELVHAVDPGDGSWVSMAVDDRGRLITSAQGGGMYRVTPGPLGAGAADAAVEPIDVPFGQAQGLAWVDGDLYVVTNGNQSYVPPATAAVPAPEPVSVPQGLYRVRDTDGDDTFDRWELLRAIPGNGGEHGPHAVVPGPDGMLYLAVGNHIPPIEYERSAVPRVWGEDQVLPRMWDPRGHAVGIMAPGGWIARTDRDGQTWELLAIGFRNEYDLAFDARGELFAYDADMEWDMGTPWYRATRLVHVVSGADYGWRSGSGKWPPYAEESLPPVLEIGPGSPTGMLSGASARLAPGDADALLLMDWTFGTVHLVTLTPKGSSFTARRQTLVSGRPFPVADGVVSPVDGAVYLVLGGRGLPSAIYRVYHPQGGHSAAPTDALADQRELRHRIEDFHHPSRDETVVPFAWPHLSSPDRFLRHAARVALEHHPIADWYDLVMAEREARPRLAGLVALARRGDGTLGGALSRALADMRLDDLEVEQRLAWTRALELTIVRQGALDPDAADAMRQDMAAHFPTGESRVDRELATLLVRLGDPTIVATAIAQMERAGSAPAAADPTLLERNESYGRVILEMAANPPQLQPIHYAAVLRAADTGWTPALRERYFRWFDSARRAAGGNSYVGFLDRIRQEALERVPEAERVHLAALAADPMGREAAPEPRGPGRPWTVNEVASVARERLEHRDFENGRRMFVAAACNVCHRFSDDTSGIGGPDLTALSTRFTPRDLVEAIVEPSRVVSDQYSFEAIELDDGRTEIGRVIDDRDGQLVLLRDLLQPDDKTMIPHERVRSRQPSAISPMPPALLDRLGRDEVADLLAYLLSEGDPRSAYFAPQGP